jgi:hypothetical protein
VHERLVDGPQRALVDHARDRFGEGGPLLLVHVLTVERRVHDRHHGAP